MKLRRGLLLAIMGGAITTAAGREASAAVVHALGDSSTAGFSQGAFTGESPRGWDFLVNSPGVQVTQLGVNAALSSVPITLSLWDDSTMTLLAQTTVMSTAGGWVFADLASAVALTEGQVYSVIGWADTTNLGSAWYLYNNSPPSSFTPTGTIEYLNARYDNGVGADVFPSSTLFASQYGVVDIGYEIGTPAVPEPASMVSLASALVVGLGVQVRRRRARG